MEHVHTLIEGMRARACEILFHASINLSDGERWNERLLFICPDSDDSAVVEVSIDPQNLTVEENGTATYTVALTGNPGRDVIVTPRSDNPDVRVFPASLSFNSGNWNMPQTVTVSAAADEDANNEIATVIQSVTGLGDLTDGGAVAVTVVDGGVRGRKTDDRKEAGVPSATLIVRTGRIISSAFDNLSSAALAERECPVPSRPNCPEEPDGNGRAGQNATSNTGAWFSAPSGGGSHSVADMSVAFAPIDSQSQGSIWIPDSFDGRDGDGWPALRRTITGDDLLRSGSFDISLGASQGDKNPMPDASKRLTVWGRGDFQFFESGGGRKSGYEGNLIAGYLGADLAMDGGWLFGLAVSRIITKTDYTAADYTSSSAGASGELEAKLTNVHPYVRVAVGEKAEVWTILGLGRGQVTNATRQGESTSDLSMKMVSAGGRQGLGKVGGVDLAILADGSSATVGTEDGVESIAGILADVWRVRIGTEASYTIGWDDGSALTSFLEVAGRRDGGDSAQGDGLELSSGLAFSDPESGFAVQARGRMLVLHDVDNHGEYGASITAGLAPGARGHGLSIAIAPTWGTVDGPLGAKGPSLSPSHADARRSNSVSLNSWVAYGFAAGIGVLTPFVDFSLRDRDSHRIRAGSRYSVGSSLNLELAADRSQDGSEVSEHAVLLSAGLRF